MTGVARRWVRDLALGFRLAVGGSRTYPTSWVRLGMGAVGIGLAVAVLLGAASAGSVVSARDARQAAQNADTTPREGVRPTHMQWVHTNFREHMVTGYLVRHEDATSPVPPGIPRQLKPGEMMVSPELKRLLSSPDGKLLRPRFAEYRIVGTIGRAGVIEPADLWFVAGDQGWQPESKVVGGEVMADEPTKAYAFGAWADEEPMPFELVLLVAVASVALLIPLLIFVVSSSRVAGAERDRRLAALRLVGGDRYQVRRIAAGESLVSAIIGLALGSVLFFVLRPLAGDIRWWGVSIYPDDIVPSWGLAALIVLGVPLLSVAVSLVAMRRTVVEPLGVVRQGKSIRRRLWWRVVTLVTGVVLLLFAFSWSDTIVGVIVGASFLVLGVAALLPWAVEAVIRRMAGGSPALQLATRRLQVDSGSAARVVSGIVVVLTGAIALVLVLGSTDDRVQAASSARAMLQPAPAERTVMIQGMVGDVEPTAAKLEQLPGVRAVHGSWEVFTSPDVSSVVGDCFVLRRMANLPKCADGDVFILGGLQPLQPLQPGQRVRLDVGGKRVAWRLPERATTAQAYPGYDFHAALITPGALDVVPSGSRNGVFFLEAPGTTARQQADLLEHVRNALGLTQSTYVTMSDYQDPLAPEIETYESIKTGIYAGSVIVMFLAALSVLVLAVEQVRERRRALAAVSASGVGFGTLARSLLWQNAIPLCIGVGLAIAGGTLLAHLVIRLTSVELVFDWLPVAGAAGLAAALVLFVTLLSLPALRAAVSVKNLRTE